jgi:hypothetical protein
MIKNALQMRVRKHSKENTHGLAKRGKSGKIINQKGAYGKANKISAT